MTSFQITISPHRRAAARFIAKVRREIEKAFVEEQQKRGLSQSDIARVLRVHRSVINRELRGTKDMTLGRVGEFAHVLGRRPDFSLALTESPKDNHAGFKIKLPEPARGTTNRASSNAQSAELEVA